MTGHRIRLPAGTPVKDGKVGKRQSRKAVSEHIRQKKSTRVRVTKRTP